MGSKIRTFVAVDVPPIVRGAIVRETAPLRAAAPDYNWVPADNLHLTLNFLGDVVDREIPDICRAIERAASPMEEFEVELIGAGAFPDADRPRVVWIGVREGRESLCQLQAALAEALAEFGFSGDRSVYTPHLTLARAGRQGHRLDPLRPEIEALAEKPFGVVSVDEVVVYASYRDRAGPSYTPMASISLAY